LYHLAVILPLFLIRGGRVDDGFLLRALLAGNVADCSFSPPLLPTQCAIMRALALFGVLGLLTRAA